MSNASLLLPLLPLLGIGGFVAFWCLIVKMLSLAGWQRLAQYQLPRPLGWPTTTVGRARLGGVSYKNVIKAGAQAEGLVLESMFMFRLGHPPLLIPWAAIGPVQAEKSFWSTTYTTSIRTENGGSVNFQFSSDRLAQAVQPWLQLLGR